MNEPKSKTILQLDDHPNDVQIYCDDFTDDGTTEHVVAVFVRGDVTTYSCNNLREGRSVFWQQVKAHQDGLL